MTTTVQPLRHGTGTSASPQCLSFMRSWILNRCDNAASQSIDRCNLADVVASQCFYIYIYLSLYLQYIYRELLLGGFACCLSPNCKSWRYVCSMCFLQRHAELIPTVKTCVGNRGRKCICHDDAQPRHFVVANHEIEEGEVSLHLVLWRRL